MRPPCAWNVQSPLEGTHTQDLLKPPNGPVSGCHCSPLLPPTPHSGAKDKARQRG